MCVLGVADAVGRAAGGGLAASRVLPLCCPLTFAPGLNRRQLATALGVIRGMLDRIETERMPGLPEAPPSPAPTRERERTRPSPPKPILRVDDGDCRLGDKVPPERERHARRDERRRTTARASAWVSRRRHERGGSARRGVILSRRPCESFHRARGSSAAERGERDDDGEHVPGDARERRAREATRGGRVALMSQGDAERDLGTM